MRFYSRIHRPDPICVFYVYPNNCVCLVRFLKVEKFTQVFHLTPLPGETSLTKSIHQHFEAA